MTVIYCSCRAQSCSQEIPLEVESIEAGWVAMPAGRAEVLVFLDVDGVLNADWHGLGFGRSEDLEGLVALEPAMLAALASLLRRVEAEVAPPRIVLSSTWRLSAARKALLLASLREVGVSPNCLAQMGETPRASNCGTTPEGRAEEIGAWLCAERARREHEVLQDDNGHSSTWRPLFLVLDDLDLMVDSVGKPIFGHIHRTHFVHTAPNQSRSHDACSPGLNPSRVEEALAKLQEQALRNQLDESPTGAYTREEWEILQESGLPLEVLKTHACPLWIREAARRYIAKFRARTQVAAPTKSLCLSHCACV
jgi:hypothetical protein